MTHALTAPCDLDSEALVLSACLLSGSALVEVRSMLQPEAFYADANRRIYEAILAVDDAHGKVDEVLVVGRLRESGRLQQIGGTPYLAQVIHGTPAIINVADHARIVADKARLRSMIATCQRFAAEGYSDVGDTDEWCSEVVSELARVADSTTLDDTLCTAAEASERTMALIADRKNERAAAPGIATGFLELDAKLGGGLRRGCQYCVAGRPGHGKTAFALGIAINVATDGYGVAFVSCEMPTEQLSIRAIAQIGALDGTALERGAGLTPDEWSKASAAATKFSALPIAIDDRPAQTASGIRTTVRRAIARLRKKNPGLKLGLVIVDYVQILRGDRRRGESREQEVAELSRSMLWLAKELDCPVLTLSQLSRESVKRPGEYKLSDLRESGAIEADNFGVFFVHRDDADENDDKKHTGEAKIIIGKVRQGGSTGIVHMRFDGPATTFYEGEARQRGQQSFADVEPEPDYPIPEDERRYP